MPLPGRKVAGILVIGWIPAPGAAYGIPLTAVVMAEKVWRCLRPGIKLGGIVEKGGRGGTGAVEARCCLVCTLVLSWVHG